MLREERAKEVTQGPVESKWGASILDLGRTLNHFAM